MQRNVMQLSKTIVAQHFKLLTIMAQHFKLLWHAGWSCLVALAATLHWHHTHWQSHTGCNSTCLQSSL
jgi:hypothetical protein